MMGGMVFGLIFLAVNADSLWRLGVERSVQVAAVLAAGGVIWTKAFAPLVFRPVGKALAHGARKEAEQAVHDLVDPQVQKLSEGQVDLGNQLHHLRSQVAAILDRMPHDQ